MLSIVLFLVNWRLCRISEEWVELADLMRVRLSLMQRDLTFYADTMQTCNEKENVEATPSQQHLSGVCKRHVLGNLHVRREGAGEEGGAEGSLIRKTNNQR